MVSPRKSYIYKAIYYLIIPNGYSTQLHKLNASPSIPLNPYYRRWSALLKCYGSFEALLCDSHFSEPSSIDLPNLDTGYSHKECHSFCLTIVAFPMPQKSPTS